MHYHTPDHIKFIEIVSDGTRRKYRGYFDEINIKYILISVDDDSMKLEKHSADIGEDLFDPFVELKSIHGF